MSSISSISKNISKRSLTFNKSFMISIALHIVLIFGISITTYYKLPIFNESPIINVKLANSNQDLMTNISSDGIDNSKKEASLEAIGITQERKNSSQSFKIKKLQANSIVNSEEAVYLNLWQRKIETTGDKIISNKENYLDGKVQIMATIDMNGNLINSQILISSGNRLIDNMAINILEESAPFAPFNNNMSNQYSVLEIVRDWNFSSN
ncbi:MAG: TonB family protein [SAR86 cluster bacterium]|uniref:TonB family protein n=1 Tax=SAR86 cluster bacterium TaxID=2030880 RepID=A0A520N2Q3_9GAMM|nr:MAG: TonB family protein [SAR86 cluster bacterium]|tara:strand:- start:1781 stop:2407 length:627 start_codon:yes stop_codon:yes gene_type:complete